MTTTTLIHYAGKLEIPRARGRTTVIFPGFAACSSGLKALEIRERREHTYKRDEVTCKRCLAQIAKATT